MTAQSAEKYFVSENSSSDPSESLKRYKYLLGLTDVFSHFINAKAKKDAKFGRVVKEIKSEISQKRRKTEKEEDAELLKSGDTDSVFEFTESPGFVHGKLRPYQIQGLNWLISLDENNISGILADEMGLGKTLQTISFLGYLRFIRNIKGPHLVIVPKSTLNNWAREFAHWIPDIKTLVIQGDKEERAALIKDRLLGCDFDVVIASYEIVMREKSSLKKFAWRYIIIDEAHRIKNEESLLSQIIRMFYSKNRLLITGTPLQNNLHELWALLNFILPDVFSDSEAFDSWFESSENKGDDSVVKQLHKVLQPFLLRRIKADVEKSLLPKKEVNVYLGMSAMQRTWYQKLLEKDLDAVNGSTGKKESKTRLLNIVMQLRKCCNHPYLFEGAEPGPPYTTDEHLVYNSQKMKILDKLLKRMKERGSRVLIFSQMSRMLDILEDYCVFREFSYCRIDGQTDHPDRVKAIDDYNAPDSEKFVFLLTTRAGGLGINLTSADVVVLFDSDWNPQADLQAMDRAHRIGQKKQVQVFRFVTENAIEEKVIERASQKLRLDQLVIQQGRSIGDANKGQSKDELITMIQHGAAEMFKPKPKGARQEDDDDIDKILAESESKTKQLNSRYANLGLDDLQNFTSDSVYEWNGKNFQKKVPEANVLGNMGFDWMHPSKRERKENYSIDGYYQTVLNTGGQRSAPKPVGPRPPKQVYLQDHQFYPARLQEVYDLEMAYFKKRTGASVGEKADSREQRLAQSLDQLEIDKARPLTESEEQEKTLLLEQGFGDWTKKDFLHFISLCAKCGRNNITSISSEMDGKSRERVETYAQVFWKRFREIDGHEKYIGQIEAGEERTLRVKIQKEALRRKMAQYENPLQQLKLKYPPASSASKRVYSEDEDRFLLCMLHRFGLDNFGVMERIRRTLLQSECFKYDFFFLSRNITELQKRCAHIMGCLLREFDTPVMHGTKRVIPAYEDFGYKRKRT